MDASPVIATAACAGAGLAAGWLLGRLHFGTLEYLVRCWLEGNARRALVLQVARLALLALALAALARLGAAMLLWALAGILLARARLWRYRGYPS